MAVNTRGCRRQRTALRVRAATTYGLALAICLAASLSARGVTGTGAESVVPERQSLLFSLLEDFGSYQCVRVEEEGEPESAQATVFDFTAQQGSEKSGEKGANGTSEAAPFDQFIVRFATYRFSEEHRQTLETHTLAHEAGEAWTWVDRSNEAAKYTTDFGVVRLPSGRGGLRKLFGRPHAKARIWELG